MNYNVNGNIDNQMLKCFAAHKNTSIFLDTDYIWLEDKTDT